MKSLNQIQIKQVKKMRPDYAKKIHGNTKKIGALSVDIYRDIMKKKYNRFFGNYVTKTGKIIYEYNFKKLKQSPAAKCRELLQWSMKCKGTPYYKELIEGGTSIYYASPVYGHADYNKSRVFEKNEKTLKLMGLFNNILNKEIK